MMLPNDIHASSLEQMLLSGTATRRLLAACALGGLIGIEREWRHKDSGLRTNMLICMGAALFTIMSEVLAGDSTPNKGQVAANIVQGIGFLGAGLILHTKNRVLGLTTAATVFVVAAIGMSCGAGMYMTAVVSTVIVYVSLQFIGALENRVGWKPYSVIYEVRADVGVALSKESVGLPKAEELAETREAARHRMYNAILRVLDTTGERLRLMDHDNIAGMERVSFTLFATRKVHADVLAGLRASDATDTVLVFRDPEEE